MRGADLSGATFAHAVFDYADMRKVKISRAAETGASMSTASFSGTNLSEAFLDSVDFYGADLSGVDFSGSCLVGANFADACLDGANMCEANLRNADLRGASLGEAPLPRFPDMSIATVLSGACCEGAHANAQTVWPFGFDPVAAGVIFE